MKIIQNKKKGIIMESLLEYYYNLGNALHKLYDGQHLSTSELYLIGNATAKDKILAMEFNASERLKLRNDKSYQTFQRNTKSLTMVYKDYKEKQNEDSIKKK